MHIAIILGSLSALFFIPSEAFAWGPATHLELGREILANHSSIAPSISAIIKTYMYDFYYGNISADIVVGKNLVEELKHCHNWKFGFKLLKKAENDSQKAFAYGYLSHLAADTVAHNNFIPEMTVRTFSTIVHRHTYWEMRFDMLMDKNVWSIPKQIEKKVHRDNDALLKSTLEDAPLPFVTNKAIFNSIINVHKISHWHRMLALLSKNSQWALHKEDKDRFFNEALRRAVDVLSHGEHAKILKYDPTGKANLKAANEARKKLRAMRKNGGDWMGELKKTVKEVAI